MYSPVLSCTFAASFTQMLPSMIQQFPCQTPEKELRYSIKRRLTELKYARKNAVVTAIRRDCNISHATMSRYINEREDDKNIMPVVVLKAFAEHLGVTMEQLFNK